MDLREAFWPLLGNWTGVERLGPDGGIARAMIVFKLDLQDRAVVQDYRRVSEDGTEYTGHGVFMVEPVSSELLWWFFGSSGALPTVARGGWVGGQLVATAVDASGPRELGFEVVDDRLAHWELDTSDPAATVRLRVGSYRRISGH